MHNGEKLLRSGAAKSESWWKSENALDHTLERNGGGR